MLQGLSAGFGKYGIPDELQVYLQDVSDHLTRVNSQVAEIRDALTQILSVNATLVSQRQNEDMKKISGWAAILFAPTLIAAIYGMNFDLHAGAELAARLSVRRHLDGRLRPAAVSDLQTAQVDVDPSCLSNKKGLRMSERIVLAGVDIVDVRTGDVHRSRSVTIQDGVIAAIDTESVTGGPQIVDAAGSYLVPGFNDMHAHPLELADPSGAFELMVAFGVTGYRQMSGSPELLRRRDAGEFTGTATRPDLLALPGGLLTPLNAATPDLAVAEIRAQKAQGADFIKMGAASAAAYPAAQSGANTLGIPLGGHLPNETDALVASRSGIRFIEHLGPGGVILLSCSPDEQALRQLLSKQPQVTLPSLRVPFMDRIVSALLKRIVVNPMMRTAPQMVDILDRIVDSFDEERARRVAAIFVENETWQSPTLIREHTNEIGDDPEWQADPDLRYVSEKTHKLWQKTQKKFSELPDSTRRVFRSLYEAQQRLTGIFAEEGVPMIAGTDITGASWEIPGSSLHREFDELGSAGLTPLQVLQATTIEAARFLHLGDSRGQVEVGMKADLVLLDGDPTRSVARLHRINGVISAGHFHSRVDLDALLRRAALRRTAA